LRLRGRSQDLNSASSSNVPVMSFATCASAATSPRGSLVSSARQKHYLARSRLCLPMAGELRNSVNEMRLIGCCGANCGTCRSFIIRQCVGCRFGYDDGTRNLKVSKCEVKRCCLGKGTLVTCADCSDYPKCRRIRAFHVRKGSKYADYCRPVDYIRRFGYRRYLRMARRWKGPYGPLD